MATALNKISQSYLNLYRNKHTVKIHPCVTATIATLSILGSSFCVTGCTSQTDTGSSSTPSASSGGQAKVEERDAPGGSLTFSQSPIGIEEKMTLSAKEFVAPTKYGLLICRPVDSDSANSSASVNLVMLEVNGERYAMNGTARSSTMMAKLNLKDSMDATSGPVYNASMKGDIAKVGIDLAHGIAPPADYAP